MYKKVQNNKQFCRTQRPKSTELSLPFSLDIQINDVNCYLKRKCRCVAILCKFHIEYKGINYVSDYLDRAFDC